MSRDDELALAVAVGVADPPETWRDWIDDGVAVGLLLVAGYMGLLLAGCA